MGEEDSRLNDKLSIEDGGDDIEDPDRYPIEFGVPTGLEEDQMMAEVPRLDCFAGQPCEQQPCPLRHLHDPK